MTSRSFQGARTFIICRETSRRQGFAGCVPFWLSYAGEHHLPALGFGAPEGLIAVERAPKLTRDEVPLPSQTVCVDERDKLLSDKHVRQMTSSGRDDKHPTTRNQESAMAS